MDDIGMSALAAGLANCFQRLLKMRRRWIYPQNGEPYEVTQDHIQAPRGPMVYGDLPSYQSPIDGRWIDGRVARKEDLARNNCRPWEGMAQEKKEAVRREGYEQQRLDRKLDAQINKSWAQLSERSKRILSDF
jgi:hypothetical protein